MARPTKFDQSKADEICKRLAAGCTRRDSAESVGVTYLTLLNWIKSNYSFCTQVSQSEAVASVAMTAVIRTAADGREVTKTTVISKPQVITVMEDNGTGGTSQVAKTIYVDEIKTERYIEYDWRAALEWLKRRRRLEWGDKIDVNLGKMTDEELLESLRQDIGEE